LRTIKSHEVDIKYKERDIIRWEKEKKEIANDEALPEHERRERKKNEQGAPEQPWPRDYLNETRVSTNKLTRGADLIKTRNEQIRSIKSQYDFFDTLVKALTNIVKQSCPICLEDKVFFDLIDQKGEGDKVSVLPCGHLLCDGCCAGLIKEINGKPPSCPMCRVRINHRDGQVMTVTIRKPVEDKPAPAEIEKKTDIEKYGTKVCEFIKFAQQTMQDDQESKIILFIQFNR
jgi:hypothetical protein